MKKVSLIMPVFGVEPYIRDTINSIIKQTCYDFELVIVNDETKDKSIEIAKYLLSNSDVDYRIIDRKNGGLSAARNTGILESKGEYLAFIDSDDVIHPEYVQTLLSDIETNGVELAIANYKSVSEQSKFDFDTNIKCGKVVNKKNFLKKILKRKIFNYFGCFMIAKNYILANNMFFDETVFFGVDQAYMWRLMVNVERYTYNYKVVYNYLDRPGSIMTSTKISKMLTGLPSLEKCAQELSNNTFFDSSFIVERWKLSALHTISKSNDFLTFKNAFKSFKPHFSICLRYPDFKVKIIALSRLFGLKFVYFLMRRF